MLSGPLTRYGVWQHLAVDQISTVPGFLLSRLYQKTGKLGWEGTPNAVWLTSNLAGRFFLVSYHNGPEVSVCWIEPGELFRCGPPGRQRHLDRLVRPEEPITDRQRSLTLWA